MYIQLKETKAIFPSNANGAIRAEVEVPLRFVMNGQVALEAYLNEKITGGGALEDLHYWVVRANGMTLVFAVTGTVRHLAHNVLDETAYAALPEVVYSMEVARIGFGYKLVQVKARCWEEAQSRAVDEACNTLLFERDADYYVLSGSEVACG